MATTTNHSRRDFLAHLSALGVAGLVGGRLDLAGDRGGASNGPRLHEMRVEDFAKHVGQTFVIHDGGRCLEAELIKVKRRQGRSARGMSRQQFSVLFRLHGNEPVPHQTYTVEHSLMGKFELFLGAVGPPSGSSARLEAVFA
jgi:hypothetical protein